MKLTCDLCGSPLQMNPGGQDASCTFCGLQYPRARLQELLRQLSETNENTRHPEELPSENPVQNTNPLPAPFDGGQLLDASFVPAPLRAEQFVMEVNSFSHGDIVGYIRQGGVGLGDPIYLDKTYRTGHTVNSLEGPVCLKAGSAAQLYVGSLSKARNPGIQVITGVPNPVPNAYNYPGTPEQFFAAVLLEDFPEYTVYADVRHPDLKIPITFLLCGPGKTAAILLVDSDDSSGRWQVTKAQKLLAQQGIGFTHFYEDYRSDRPYVTDRIRGILG